MVTSRLSELRLSDHDTIIVRHPPVPSPQDWGKVLQNACTDLKDLPQYSLTKTLVFKAKGMKKAGTETDEKEIKLAMLIALESTTSTSSMIARAIGAKEVRLAAPEVVQSVFGVGVKELSPFALKSDKTDLVHVAIDSKVLELSHCLAFHPSSIKETVLISSSQLQNHLQKLGVQINSVDFSSTVDSSATQNNMTKMAAKIAKENAAIEGASLIGITVKKEGDFAGWYQQVLLKGDMLDYYDVSGCYIMKPWSYFVWEIIQRWFDSEIKKLGVENAYFPMFVSSRVLEKEKDHIEGFAPEVAWVTRAGKSELEEPIAIRPTSETVMYPYYAKWIKSHRDLPLKLNQWNSVVRWEFKNPQPFIRTREFLWQEGHTAYADEQSAMEEVYKILHLYRKVYEDLLAVPVIMGVKSENEKFAGGLLTTTVEGFIPTTGRGIQGGTSHCLGQNFSKMFNISVENPEDANQRLFVWQNSWGLSTRTIGVMVMTHGDNKGLVMPPLVSQIQVVIVPCGVSVSSNAEVRQSINLCCEKIQTELRQAGIRVKYDNRENYTPGYKFNHWELRGVPLRIEIGPKDLQQNQAMSVRRDTGFKKPLLLNDIIDEVAHLLKDVQSNMYRLAHQAYHSHVKKLTKWEDVVPALDSLNVCLVPWCRRSECEDQIKERSKRKDVYDEPQDERAPSMGAKSLCIPLEQPEISDHRCINCEQSATCWGLFGRSY